MYLTTYPFIQISQQPYLQVSTVLVLRGDCLCTVQYSTVSVYLLVWGSVRLIKLTIIGPSILYCMCMYMYMYIVDYSFISFHCILRVGVMIL